jgi:hypothetical protein
LGLLAILITMLTGGEVAASSEGAIPVDPPFLLTLVVISVRNLIMFLPFVAIAAFMLWQSGVWERQVIRDELADETEPVITPAEYETIKQDRIFRTRRIDGINRKTSAAIVKAQNELAIRKWRLKHNGKDVATDPLVNSWRGELARLRDRYRPL